MDGRSEPPLQQSSPPAAGGELPVKPPFDRERFLFVLLAAVIISEFSIYLLAGTVCAWRLVFLDAKACPEFLMRLHTATESALNLILALLGGAAIGSSISRGKP